MKSLFITYKNIDPSSVTSLAIGGFDGIHLAHQKLLSQLDERGALLAIEKPVMGLTPRRAREYFCDKPIFYLDLKDVMQLGSDEFLRILLAEFTGLKKIVVGYDFRFGKGRAGGIEDIRRAFGGSVCVVEDVQLDGVSIHATDIINLVRAGELARANVYLGRAYMLEGAVIRGQGLGAKSLYPTINLQVADGYTVPKEGVYVGQTEIVEVFETPSGDQDPSGDDVSATSAQDLSARAQDPSPTVSATTQDLGFSTGQDLSHTSTQDLNSASTKDLNPHPHTQDPSGLQDLVSTQDPSAHDHSQDLASCQDPSTSTKPQDPAQDLSSARTCNLSLTRTHAQDPSLIPTTNRELALNMARSTTQDLASTRDPNSASAYDLKHAQDLGFSAGQDLSHTSTQDLSNASTKDLNPHSHAQDPSGLQDLANTKDLNPARAKDLSQTNASAKLYPSVIFVGHRLSTDGSFCIETHILGGAANFNAKKVKLHFLDFLRENKKFSDLSQLKASITADINKARSYFA